MNENNVQDAQVVDRPAVDVQQDILRVQVTANRDDFKKQLGQLNEAITSREEELRNMNIKKLKLQGAIEASELLLKPTPTK